MELLLISLHAFMAASHSSSQWSFVKRGHQFTKVNPTSWLAHARGLAHSRSCTCAGARSGVREGATRARGQARAHAGERARACVLDYVGTTFGLLSNHVWAMY
jgi:hypothetical protein